MINARRKQGILELSRLCNEVMITGSCQLFFKKYYLEVGVVTARVKSSREDQVQIPGIHVRAGFGVAPL